MSKLKFYLFGIGLSIISIGASCPGNPPAPPVTSCDACSLYKNPETVRVCQSVYCVSARPTATQAATAAPTATVVPVVTATLIPTISKPTNTPAPKGQTPPTVDFVNGCDASNPNSVNPATGVCEFNIWMKLTIPDMINFTPACGNNCSPAFWHPPGMGLACDHMYADQGAASAVFEPKIGKWVTVMYYVCSGRLWDSVINFDVHAVSGSISWTPRTNRPDPYNGIIAGHGSYVVCMPSDAYTCKDPNDLNDPKVYDIGVCPSGNILLNSQACVGPYTVNR